MGRGLRNPGKPVSRPHLSTKAPCLSSAPAPYTHCVLSPWARGSRALRIQPVPEPMCRKGCGPPGVPSKARLSCPGSPSPAGLGAPQLASPELWGPAQLLVCGLSAAVQEGWGLGQERASGQGLLGKDRVQAPWLPSEQGAQDSVCWLLALAAHQPVTLGQLHSHRGGDSRKTGVVASVVCPFIFAVSCQYRRHGFKPWVSGLQSVGPQKSRT